MLRDHEPSSTFQAFSRVLGAMLDVELGASAPRQFQLREIKDWFEPPIVLGQYALFTDPSGMASEAVTWAYVSDEVHAGLLASDHDIVLELDEWNAGRNLWIIDILSRRSQAEVLLDWATTSLVADKGSLNWRARVGRRFTGPHVSRHLEPSRPSAGKMPVPPAPLQGDLEVQA